MVFLIVWVVAAAGPSDRSAEPQAAFDEQDFARARAVAQERLRESLLPPEVEKLRRIAAFSAFFLGDRTACEVELMAIFRANPAATIDTKLHPPQLVSFFNEIKAKLAAQALPATASVEEQLGRLRQLADDAYFERLIPAAEKLLQSKPTPAHKRVVLELLFKAQFYVGRADAAAESARALLTLDPKVQMDVKREPPQLVEFFNQMRASVAKHKDEESKASVILRQAEVDRQAAQRRLRVGAYIMFGAAVLALAGASASFGVSEVARFRLIGDVNTYNGQSMRAKPQFDALNRRAADVAMLDVITVTTASVGIAAMVAGATLFGLARRNDMQARIDGVAFGPAALSMFGHF